VVSAYERKKQPELVRRALLDSAARLAAEQGLAAVTIQAVADAAGVTKGGLFHHFQSKQALVEAMFTDLLLRLDMEIDSRIARDAMAFGCFTRAYVDVLFSDGDWSLASPWSALSISMTVEPGLRALWTGWTHKRLERHRATDNAPMLDIVRLATDGAWISYAGQTEVMPQATRNIHAQLVALTRPG
jgi:AcrR family transcriptional regulator